MKALQTMLAVAVLASVSSVSYAGRCDGNNGNGNGNICTPEATTPTPVTSPHTTDTNRKYIERVHSYAHGNSLAVQALRRTTNGLEANKVDKTEFVKDQQRQDARDDSQDKHIIAVQNAAQIANEKGDANAVRSDNIEKNLSITDNRSINNSVRLDGVEGSVRETNVQLAVTDKRSIDNSVRIDKTENVNQRQDVSINELNKQTTAINDTLNYHGDVLNNHQQQINDLGSRMSGEIANALNVAQDARKQAKIAQDQAVASLAVAGHSYNHTDYGLQTAISVASFGGSTALAIGAGGKVSDRIFLNAAVTSAGSATGGVVSTTLKW